RTIGGQRNRHDATISQGEMSGEFRRDGSPGASLAGRQLDRLAVRSRARGGVPFVHAPFQLVSEDELLPGDELLQRGEPMHVVMGAVVRLAAGARRGELGRERV